jgi:hypothetical protein
LVIHFLTVKIFFFELWEVGLDNGGDTYESPEVNIKEEGQPATQWSRQKFVGEGSMQRVSHTHQARQTLMAWILSPLTIDILSFGLLHGPVDLFLVGCWVPLLW